MWQVAPTSGEASPLPLQAAGSDKGLLLYHRYPHPSVPHTASGLGTLRVLLNQRLRPEIPTVGHVNNTRVIMIRNISKGEPSRKYALMESDSQCAYIYIYIYDLRGKSQAMFLIIIYCQQYDNSFYKQAL